MTNPRKARRAAVPEEVWPEGRAEAVDASLAAADTIHDDPGDPWEGQVLDRAGFNARLAASRAVAPDRRVTPLRMLQEGDAVAVFRSWPGTHLGEGPGLSPPTGRVLAMTGATLYDFDAEDRPTGPWQVADRLGTRRQITA